MKSYSPNLKPEQLHSHSDAAERLGVPRSNILDLRAMRVQAESVRQTNAPASMQLSWWQRRKARRLHAQQAMVEQANRHQTDSAAQTVSANVDTSAQSSAMAADIATSPASVIESAAVTPAVTAGPLEINEPETVLIEDVPNQAVSSAETFSVNQRTVVDRVTVPAVANQMSDAATTLNIDTTDLTTNQTAEPEDVFAHVPEPVPVILPKPVTAAEIVNSAEASNTPSAVETLLPRLPRRSDTQSHRQSSHKVRYHWQWHWRPVIAFAVVSALCVTPLGTLALLQRVSTARNQIETISTEATHQLSQAASSSSQLDFMGAVTSFDSAATNFRDAHDQLVSINEALTPLLRALPNNGNQFSSAENILIAGEQLAAAGADVATAFGVLEQYTEQSSLASSSTDLLVTAHSAFRPAVPRLERAAIAFNAIDLDTVPADYRAEIETAQAVVPVVAQSLDELLSLSETLLMMLGHDEPKRYLVLFQNNRELRATGGFIGSFAVVDINQGKVSAIEIPGGGPYDLAGAFKERIISPQPMHLVNSRWQLQDANWWPDFPTSAKKIQWFYRKSGGSSVDGVITLTPDVIEQMLTITGPISLPEYDVTVTADNFYEITQTQAERKYDDTRESKKFIADLTPKLLNKLFALDLHNFVPVLQIVYTALSEKDILLYFNDVFLQNELAQRGWTGEVKTTSGDYVMVVDTNIGGGKTDAAITETIEHQADIQADGSVIDTVTITRTHTGASGDVFADVNNVDYVRLYTPAGSTLLSATGFTQPDPALFLPVMDGYEHDIDLETISGDILIDEASQTRINQEFGKTVFGNWLQTEPGKTSKAVLQYRLPFTVKPQGLFQPATRYSLLVQKQAGSFDPLVITKVIYPSDYQVLWSYPNTAGSLHQALQNDSFTGLVFE